MNIKKQMLLFIFAGALGLGAGAQQLINKLQLKGEQRQQILTILKSGDRSKAATRQRMQRQVMAVLTPRQENQLNYELQQQASRNNTTAYYNKRYENDGYNRSGSNNNSGYYSNNGYDNSDSNNRNMLRGLLNNGILNGVLRNLVER